MDSTTITEAEACTLTYHVESETFQIQGSKNKTILQMGMETGRRIPHACQVGGCGQCRAVLREGYVRMKVNHVLDTDELEKNLILTCQAIPLTDTIVIDYDAAEEI